MLSEEQKRRAVIDGQSMVGKFLNAARVEMSNAIADIGVKVVEEGWFDKSMPERLSDVRQTILDNTNAIEDLAFQHGYEKGMQDAMASVYGTQEVQPPEPQEMGQDELER